jgi:hypothetical protein
MLKAMHGCVQASLLWHRLLVKVLKGLGFEQCEVDPCIMRLVNNFMVHVIMIYVDDLLLFATKAVIDMVLAKLKERFQWLTVERGVVTMLYLGCSWFLEMITSRLTWCFIWRRCLKESMV